MKDGLAWVSEKIMIWMQMNLSKTGQYRTLEASFKRVEGYRETKAIKERVAEVLQKGKHIGDGRLRFRTQSAGRKRGSASRRTGGRRPGFFRAEPGSRRVRHEKIRASGRPSDDLRCPASIPPTGYENATVRRWCERGRMGHYSTYLDETDTNERTTGEGGI